MRVKDKKIGIWGFGTVGKAAVNYLYYQQVQLQVMDSRALSNSEQALLSTRGIPYHSQKNITHFLEHNDIIIPSPGINLNPYSQFAHKWIAELDLFNACFNKPIIAITGTVGKTTLTHIISHLLKNRGMNICTGGNIGVGMLSFIGKKACQTALLEVSSFQLEYCYSFAPDLAIITNIYPNHLDRHGTEHDYLQAKLNIIKQQTDRQIALLPLAISSEVYEIKPQGTLYFFSATPPTRDERQKVRPQDRLLWLEDGNIIKEGNVFVASQDMPTNFFSESWLMAYAALHLLKLPLDNIHQEATKIEPLEHRLEKVATINTIDFYNDSKSTTPQSTLAAVEQLHNGPIHLFLGGLSKNVDRTDLVHQLKDHVKKVYCFGAEAKTLAQLCGKFDVPYEQHTKLEDAFHACTQNVRPYEIVLLSPAGASFDLFENYKERGKLFKELVKKEGNVPCALLNK